MYQRNIHDLCFSKQWLWNCPSLFLEKDQKQCLHGERGVCMCVCLYVCVYMLLEREVTQWWPEILEGRGHGFSVSNVVLIPIAGCGMEWASMNVWKIHLQMFWKPPDSLCRQCQPTCKFTTVCSWESKCCLSKSDFPRISWHGQDKWVDICLTNFALFTFLFFRSDIVKTKWWQTLFWQYTKNVWLKGEKELGQKCFNIQAIHCYLY